MQEGEVWEEVQEGEVWEEVEEAEEGVVTARGAIEGGRRAALAKKRLKLNQKKTSYTTGIQLVDN